MGGAWVTPVRNSKFFGGEVHGSSKGVASTFSNLRRPNRVSDVTLSATHVTRVLVVCCPSFCPVPLPTLPGLLQPVQRPAAGALRTQRPSALKHPFCTTQPCGVCLRCLFLAAQCALLPSTGLASTRASMQQQWTTSVALSPRGRQVLAQVTTSQPCFTKERMYCRQSSERTCRS